MPDEETLDPEGRLLQVHPRVALRTPGLEGRVRVYEAATAETRGADEASEALIEALSRNDLEEDLTLEIDEHRELAATEGSRGRSAGDDIVLEVRDPGEAFGQVVLYESEEGVLSWHLPAEGDPQQRRTRGGDTLTYRVPREVAGMEADAGHRGLLGAVGKKILKVLTFRLLQEGSAWVGARFAERVEVDRRPHRLRAFLPGSHAEPRTAELSAEEVRRLGEGRALLFVHGTFSTAHGGFGKLPTHTMQELHRRYDGRVFALEHPTVTKRPVENAGWLADLLRELDVRLDVDIVSHSRGGLVGRVMAERGDLAGSSDRLSVGRLVMVATPNAGTALADVDRLEHLLNRFTNLLQFVPDNGVTDTLDLVLSVLKQMASGVASGLDGLMAMNPSARFLTEELNRPGHTSATYFAAAADYEPADRSNLLRIARDAGTDMVFGRIRNDLVVPTEGVFSVPGAGTFPVADPLVFEAPAGVTHSDYWDRPDFNERLLEWLRPGG